MSKNKLSKHFWTSIIALSLVITLASSNVTLATGKADPEKGLAKNVIIMISDGWGYNQIKATNYYEFGKEMTQSYEKFPVRYAMSTYSVGSYDPAKAWSDFNYVRNAATDSAAAGTAMSTGFKTYDAAIGVDMNGNPLRHIMEQAEDLGKSTGVISTVQISHATPASFVAHNAHRNNYSAIANEMITMSSLDVLIGAGHPYYDNNGQVRSSYDYRYVGGESVWDGLVDGTLIVSDANGDGNPDPWTFIQSKGEFDSLISGETPDRLIGVAQVATTLQQSRSGDGNAAPFQVPFNANVPDLKTMTQVALNALDNNEQGFVLMIEGGAVDWAGHANQTGRLIEEQMDFNDAVLAVIRWVNTNSNWGETLLIVTGDHETGYLTGPGSNPAWTPVINMGEYNLPMAQWNSGDHTNSLIPFFAKGDAARLFRSYASSVDPIRGRYIDNTDIAKVVFSLLDN